MSVGEQIAVVGAELIRDPARRAEVVTALRATGHHVVEISEEQVRSFAGNCIELRGRDGTVLVMSQTAALALTTRQRREIEQRTQLLVVPVPTIETAGGSVRCMIAGNHLTPREQLPVGAA